MRRLPYNVAARQPPSELVMARWQRPRARANPVLSLSLSRSLLLYSSLETPARSLTLLPPGIPNEKRNLLEILIPVMDYPLTVQFVYAYNRVAKPPAAEIHCVHLDTGGHLSPGVRHFCYYPICPTPNHAANPVRENTYTRVLVSHPLSILYMHFMIKTFRVNRIVSTDRLNMNYTWREQFLWVLHLIGTSHYNVTTIEIRKTNFAIGCFTHEIDSLHCQWKLKNLRGD